MTDHRRHMERLNRQLDALGRALPIAPKALKTLRNARWRLVRLPLAVFLILGSGLAVLPVFGVWMLPLGLLLLAIDVPVLRPKVSALLISGRRRTALWRRRFRASRPQTPPS